MFRLKAPGLQGTDKQGRAKGSCWGSRMSSRIPELWRRQFFSEASSSPPHFHCRALSLLAQTLTGEHGLFKVALRMNPVIVLPGQGELGWQGVEQADL